jgi:hypothetical protein
LSKPGGAVYVAAAVSANGGNPRWQRLILGASIPVVVFAIALLTGCGGSESSDAGSTTEASPPPTQASEPSTPASSPSFPPEKKPATGKPKKRKAKAAVQTGPVYQIKIDGTEIETEQRVGKVYRLKLGWYNFGDNTVPNLAVTFSTTRGFITTTERDGRTGRPAFATAGGPVWKLLPGYPRLAGTAELAGTTSDGKTFTLGPLEPREKKLTIWKLKAVAPGRFSLKHEAAGDLSDESLTKSPYRGLAPGSWYQIEISPSGSGA